MPWYICDYPAHPSQPAASSETAVGNYSSFIFAKDIQCARKIAKQRRIGEHVQGVWGRGRAPYPRPSDMLRRRRLSASQRMAIVHGVCWLSYILSRSLEAPPEDILGDEGLLHQTIHCLQFGYPPRRHMIETLRYFERRAPGYTRAGRWT